ncbi:hypothetical protein M409DRAFT_57117 [Zasmidium cellare ATCC 36951]|uniref:Methyltransferase domain-containing protein n=1 Tax=Zasmidium cellare ATCC 36951 TaxID=1080233 RepID=A0A6A6CCR5_ZASCE|nr:uncharacterized protein M409DRAFT_57117 [Zasmidium cellare ATCC 36951]KAF2164020.1 hypothetical protein M409DRAFT_57117 [Zasmidium cellare ATCC 36951]
MAAHDWDKFKKFFENRNVAKCAPHLIRYIKPDSKIIDVGCGVGTITLDFARRVPQGSVIGIDHSEQSIATARAQVEREGVSNVEFVVGDVEDLQYPDDTFDIAHAHQVMIHLVHPVQSLRHVHRIIKPGGVVGIRDLAHLHHVGATALMNENLEKFWQDSRARGARGEGAGKVNHIWMHEAGFEWGQIEAGCAGFDNEREELPAMSEGAIGFAKARNENNEYMERLRKDVDDWVASPQSRSMVLDGRVVGKK